MIAQAEIQTGPALRIADFTSRPVPGFLTGIESDLGQLDGGRAVLPIWSINTSEGKYLARTPLSVRLAFEDGLTYAIHDELCLYGFGESPDVAIENLKLHIAYFITHYEDADIDSLAGLAVKAKKLYERCFVRE